MDSASADEIRTAVQIIIATALPRTATGEVLDLINLVEQGHYDSMPFPWNYLTELTNALLPGTITVLCGDPGGTKSFMLLEILANCHRANIPTALYELEEVRANIIRRCMAQNGAGVNILNVRWIADHIEDARRLAEGTAGFMNSFGECIWTQPPSGLTLDHVREWIKARALAGVRVIAVDPITMADSGGKPWIADKAFLEATRKIVRDHGCSLVLVTHPKKASANSAPGMNELAGGAAYQRFTDTILWLRRLDEPALTRVMRRGVVSEQMINRVLLLAKTRNGSGAGMKLGYSFHGQTMTFAEHGIIVPKGKEPKITKPINNRMLAEPSSVEDHFL
jgi:hypothetical protein